VVDRSSASAWLPNVGSCAYSAIILLRPNVKIILRPNLRLRPFSVIISALAEGDSATVYIYIILGVACTGQYITCQSSPAAIKYFYGRMCAQRGGYTMIPTCCKKTRAKYIVAGAAVVNCMPYRGPPLMQDDTLIF